MPGALARKRPRLIPVYDRVVRAAVGNPEHWWLALHDALQDQALRDRLVDLGGESMVGDDISLLRILDVAIWMTSERQPRAGSSVADRARRRSATEAIAGETSPPSQGLTARKRVGELLDINSRMLRRWIEQRHVDTGERPGA